MATLASLVVKIGADTRGFVSGLNKSKSRLKSLNKEISLTRVALASAGFVFAAKKAFDLGAAVEETASKYRTVFGPAIKDANEFLGDFANMAGLSSREGQELAGTTGAIVQGMGFLQAETAKVTAEVLTLAGDFASFNNLRTEDTTRAITAALTGEREQMKQLGIVVTEVEVQQLALAQSGKTVVGELTQQDKVTASLAIITQKAGVQIGDLARTQLSAANRAKQFGATLRDMRDTMLVALQPAFAIILDELIGVTDKMRGFIVTFAASAPTIAAWAAVAVQAFKLLAVTLAAPIRLAFNLGESITELGRLLIAFATKDAIGMQTALAALDTNLADMARAITDVTGEMLDLGLVFSNVVLTFPDVTAGINQAAGALGDFNTEAKESGDILKGLERGLSALDFKAGVSGFFKSALKFGVGNIPVVGGLLGGLFDSGGSIPSGRVGIVGERGPELVSGPANVTSRADTAAMMGGDFNFTFIFEQDGVEVRRIAERIDRDSKLGNSLRLALPAPAIG